MSLTLLSLLFKVMTWDGSRSVGGIARQLEEAATEGARVVMIVTIDGGDVAPSSSLLFLLSHL